MLNKLIVASMNILVVSNNLLWKSSPASSIEIGLLEKLTENDGLCITAICSSLNYLGGNESCFKTIVVKEKEIWKSIYRIGKKVLPGLFNIPDYHRFSWCGKAEQTANKCTTKAKYDIIHSFSHSSSCHLVALKLHKKYGLPWIATFFDSWTDYPMLKYRTSLFRNINKKLERKVAENASLLVFNNENLANLWKNRYGEVVENKIVVIPLNESFENDTPVRKRIDRRTINISHVGTFYPFRNASTFIEGVRRFTVKYPQLRDRLRINFVGRTLSSDVEKINKYKLNDCFNITGPISAEECEQVYADSDILLAIAEQPFEDYTFPSKIIKYFYYQKPILGIGTKSSVLNDELIKSEHKCIAPDDVEGIANYIYNAIMDYSSICGFNKEYWKRFDVKNVAKQYLQCFNKINVDRNH